MNKRLRILHLEDEPDFAELVRTLFARDGLDVELTCLGDRAAFEKALAADTFDVIVSDYKLPSFTGLEAMALAKERCPQTPFILVSGTIGEQAAIDSLKAGATDYVLKMHPDRLPSAVRRAVRESAARAKLQEAELELARRERYFRTLTENSLDILCIIGRDGKTLYVSPSIKSVAGYTPEEFRGESVFKRIHAEDLPRVREAFQMAFDHPERTVKIQFRSKSKGGDWLRLEAVGRNRLDDP
ncbi:MAG: response regulator [Verrucomicrobiota bacterium]